MTDELFDKLFQLFLRELTPLSFEVVKDALIRQNAAAYSQGRREGIEAAAKKALEYTGESDSYQMIGDFIRTGLK